ncbi:MAG: hypothetical protein AAF623_21930, partial [Planctomycetota bacterium]
MNPIQTRFFVAGVTTLLLTILLGCGSKTVERGVERNSPFEPQLNLKAAESLAVDSEYSFL